MQLDELSDYDFERLVADLLAAHWRVDVDTFPRGRDGGVDLRVLGPTGAPLNLGDGDVVIQCKHRPGTTLPRLRPDLRSEAARPIIDEAARYVLVTSARLTRANKQEIASTIFAGRIKERDMLAKDSLDSLLRRHSNVAKANVKLWLTNSAVLQTLLHQIEHLRSTTLASDLRRLRSTFVETAIVGKARQVVTEFGICILTGPPGVGKTTTGHILLLQYMTAGWRPVTAVAHVRELEAQLVPDENQILFFDDFLGQNSMDAKLDKGEDAELVRLMRAVERDPTKVLVLTTRDYVLKQAKQSYERLGDELFDLPGSR